MKNIIRGFYFKFMQNLQIMQEFKDNNINLSLNILCSNNNSCDIEWEKINEFIK